MCLMLVGAVSYSFAISSFSSLIHSLDSSAAHLKDKLSTLNALRSHYDLDFRLYWQLRQSLNYHHSTDLSQQLNLLKELPSPLRVALSHVIYARQLHPVQYFASKSPHFIATVGPLLRPIIVHKDQFVFLEGDPNDAVYFLRKGTVSFATHSSNSPDVIYASLPEGSFFGETDFLPLAGHSHHPERRLFSVKATTDIELLLLPKTDLYSLGV